ncbi:GNAT family N-acetyltransferase [Actinoplanes sp. NPDC049265]|uniref:GNAT family N-acetyltransferase n=1 Tax=Actinoplanes sp. NPDC049265 TaxID=3363902 RepID=UPI003719292E
MDDSVLDNPGWSSLTGPHARFADRHGRAARYPADMSPWHALEDVSDPAAWADAAELAGPGGKITLMGGPAIPPDGWTFFRGVPGVQMVGDAVAAEPDPDAVVLGPADVPELRELVQRTDPGPFEERTVEMGTYLGLRDGGRLVAMAGERLRPPGYTEISAVCTDPAYRGRGLATRLVRAVAANIRARGDVPFLHTAAFNATAIRLYTAMGFTHRGATRFASYLTQGAPGTNP